MNFKTFFISTCFLLLLGCSSVKTTEDKETIKKISIKDNKEYLKLNYSKEQEFNENDIKTEIVRKREINGTKFIEVYDPLEPLNRRIYYFNYLLDKYLLLPAVNTYEFIAPVFVQKGVSNFFSNLQEVNTFINSILQLKGRKATISLVRFGINSTIGIFGLFDVATVLELPKT